MSIREIILMDIRETKQIIRQRITNYAEEEFEKERVAGCSVGAFEFGDEILEMSHFQKESLRIKCNKDLEEQRKEIYNLWETVISRSAEFQIRVDYTKKAFVIAIILSLLFRLYPTAIVLLVFSVLLFLFTKMKRLFQAIMFVLTGCGKLSDELLEAYHKYGRLEAAILLADYRDISRISERQKTWVYTTTHAAESSG